MAGLCRNIKCPTNCPGDSTLVPIESPLKASHKTIHLYDPTIRIQTVRKRRHILYNHNNVIDDREMVQYATDTCCTHVCKCKDDFCPQPKCEDFHFLILENNFVPEVGNCCQPFDCHPKQCITDENKILNQGQLSISENDPCIECTCFNGIARCVIHQCAPLSCLHQTHPFEECCPKCDLSQTTFCLNDENCDRACRHGFIKHADGCDLCQCQTANITKTISTTALDDHHKWETSTHNNVILPDISHNITVFDVKPIHNHTLHKVLLIILLCLTITFVIVVSWLVSIGQNRWIPIRLF